VPPAPGPGLRRHGVIPVAWEEIEALALGELRGGQPGDVVRAIRADSREVGPGELFVALNTGVRYVDEARERGAFTLVPRDQEAALAALAKLLRSKSDARVVAVVGSTGKTSTKDVLGALCSAHARTIWAERSLNNEIGLPLTVLRLEPDTEILVTEMGMRGRGQIAALCDIARPDVAAVTHIGPEHLELVGTVDEVAAANAEAIAALPAGGTAVVPADAPELAPYLRRDDVTIRRFHPSDVEVENGHGRFRLDGTVVELDLPFAQRHHAVNALAALHAYAALGLPLDRAAEGASAIRLSPWRGEEHPLAGGGFVVNDAYNANPTSMRAALEDLARRAGTRRKLAVLGMMAELGPDSERFHREIGRLAADLGIEVIGVGQAARAYAPAAWAEDADAALTLARRWVKPGDSVLVKASRAVGLEGIAPAIANIARE
jgi:UDP-N-acetylmuramoyl-tripeptide--D-alanyl-D-alanine ligase